MMMIVSIVTVPKSLNHYGDDYLEDEEDTAEENLCGFDLIAACFENCDQAKLEFCPKLPRPSF